jgi:T-complex protein 1 subunit theta
MGLHPSDILLGYEKGSKKAHEIFENQVAYTVKDIRDYDEVFRCMKPSIMSKQYGLEDLLGGLITKACQMSLTKAGKL